MSLKIIIVSSAAQASVMASSFNKNIHLSDNVAYAQSKLAIFLWSFYMAEQHSDLTTIALNPGSLLNTKMAKAAYGKFWSSADKGADIIIDLATNPKYKDSSGKYFDNDRVSFGEAHPDAYDQQAISQLIELTETALGK